MSLLMALFQHKFGNDSWRLTLREDGSGMVEQVCNKRYGIDWYIVYDFDCYSELENWLMVNEE